MKAYTFTHKINLKKKDLLTKNSSSSEGFTVWYDQNFKESTGMLKCSIKQRGHCQVPSAYESWSQAKSHIETNVFIYSPAFSMNRDENSQWHACKHNSRTHQKGIFLFYDLSFTVLSEDSKCSMISYLKFGPMIKYVCFAKYLQENKDRLTIGRNYQPVADKALKL